MSLFRAIKKLAARFDVSRQVDPIEFIGGLRAEAFLESSFDRNKPFRRRFTVNKCDRKKKQRGCRESPGNRQFTTVKRKAVLL